MLEVTAEEVGAGQELAPCEVMERGELPAGGGDPSVRGGEPPRAAVPCRRRSFGLSQNTCICAWKPEPVCTSFGNTKAPALALRSPHPHPAGARRPGQVREPPAAGVEKPQCRRRVSRSRRAPLCGRDTPPRARAAIGRAARGCAGGAGPGGARGAGAG